MGKLSRNRVFTIKTKANPSLFSVKRRKLSPPAFNVPLAYGVWGQCPYFVDFVLFYLLENRDER